MPLEDHPFVPDWINATLRTVDNRVACNVPRSTLDRIAIHYGRNPRWVDWLIENGFLPKAIVEKGRGRRRGKEYFYPPGTGTHLRALCRLYQMGYRRGALRFAWWWIERKRMRGLWSPEVASFISKVWEVGKAARARMVVEQAGVASTEITSATSTTVHDKARKIVQGNTPSDQLKRVMVAKEFGLSPNEIKENPRKILGALAEEQAEEFGDNADEHIDPDAMINYLERRTILDQYLVNEAIVNGNLVQDADQIIRRSDGNMAARAWGHARTPGQQVVWRRRIRAVRAELEQLTEWERRRVGVPASGPELAERAKEVAGNILYQKALRQSGIGTSPG